MTTPFTLPFSIDVKRLTLNNSINFGSLVLIAYKTEILLTR